MFTAIVYSTPECMQCKMTYRALDKAGITYRIVDVAEDDAAREFVTDELGYSQAPVVVIDDQDHWSGFRPDQISRIAQANSSASASGTSVTTTRKDQQS
ncbi:glutaredoxin family protein [Occultella kanbiaonis]|uniref:glutaredoxin family protein n=1 Tax=Occultella kanbiaonis TaxID=2675754 RepID=UPI0025B6E5E2|nr:glutaredoxin family protein [Occultella kanbiaonis]